MPNWSPAGYDLDRSDRCLYLFHDAADGVVKLGLVLAPDRVAERLRRVSRSKKYRRPELVCVASTVLHDVTHAEAEHIEAVARHWLCNAYGFEHAGLVDWLVVPPGLGEDWQVLLDRASSAAFRFGKDQDIHELRSDET